LIISSIYLATILPDLAGHHFKQPYGKEYGILKEKITKIWQRSFYFRRYG
jgi:hypothetical protein